MQAINAIRMGGFDVLPLVEGGKGVAVSNGTTAGHWALGGGIGTIRTGCGIDALLRDSGWRCPSDFATGLAPQPATARPSANHGANALNHMQEYSVSVCFRNKTALRTLYSVFRGETQMKSPTFPSEIPAERTAPGRG